MKDGQEKSRNEWSGLALTNAVLSFGLIMGAGGCLPTVVVIDRASVIEEESAGQWTDIESALDLLHADLFPSLAPGLDPVVSPKGSSASVLPGGDVPATNTGAVPKKQNLGDASGEPQPSELRQGVDP